MYFRQPQHTHDSRFFPFFPFLAGLAVSPFLFRPRPIYYYPPYPYYRPFYTPYPYFYVFLYNQYSLHLLD
ncbi:hypothetical protein ACWE42_05915 [Sutcliffiella cohnii]|uniref:hypothetical protein n=1 Tax=Sutcliffiella TaxID=2837511 RepID=UPI000A926A74|nr:MULTISPECIES: hypothetical protein [Sutcliffiella]MED4014852.1 hypothetical protein [Sutcliffiella cohnii]WBL17405.1 hypothetical protein O1A01_12545 [Sutcliffiella sp. NC1]